MFVLDAEQKRVETEQKYCCNLYLYCIRFVCACILLINFLGGKAHCWLQSIPINAVRVERNFLGSVRFHKRLWNKKRVKLSASVGFPLFFALSSSLLLAETQNRTHSSFLYIRLKESSSKKSANKRIRENKCSRKVLERRQDTPFSCFRNDKLILPRPTSPKLYTQVKAVGFFYFQNVQSPKQWYMMKLGLCPLIFLVCGAENDSSEQI